MEKRVDGTLRDLANKLSSADGEEQIKILQNIGGKLINAYRIETFGLVIEPLWVEAYYYQEPGFPDGNTHRSIKQKNRFGRLYFHERGYGGIDICLSDTDDAYLSFLLKGTLVNGAFATQKKLLGILGCTGKTKAEFEELENILVPSAAHHSIGWAQRVNMAKPCYREARLASFALDVLPQYDFSFTHGALRDNALEYMADYMKEHPGLADREYKTECRRVFGWVPDVVSNMLREAGASVGREKI